MFYRTTPRRLHPTKPIYIPGFLEVFSKLVFAKSSWVPEGAPSFAPWPEDCPRSLPTRLFFSIAKRRTLSRCQSKERTSTRGTIYILSLGNIQCENFRAMIYYDFRCELLRQKCIDQFIPTFGHEIPSYATVKRWYNEFNRGHHSLTDELREDRPK